MPGLYDMSSLTELPLVGKVLVNVGYDSLSWYALQHTSYEQKYMVAGPTYLLRTDQVFATT